MKGNLLFAAVALSLLVLIAGISPVLAEEDKPTGDFTVSVLSAYIIKGLENSRNSIVIQPSVTVGYKGFAVNVWGNLDTSPYKPTTPVIGEKYSSNWTETDLTISYSRTLGLFNLGGGYTYYGNAGFIANGSRDFRDQQELFVSAGLNTLLAPTMTVYRMIGNSQQWYFQLGVSHILEINKAVSLKLAASGSYRISDVDPRDPDARNRIRDDGTDTFEKYNNFNDGLISASLPFKATGRITITPLIAYNFPLGNDAKNAMKYTSLKDCAFADKDSSFLYGGMSFGLSF